MSRSSSAGRSARPAQRAVSDRAGLERTRFRMASRRSAIAPTVDKILKAIEPAHLNDDQRGNFAVALAEALSNAAVHGNRLRQGSRVLVSVETLPGREASVEIADSGSGFDRSTLGDPTDPARLLATGGRGVFLMRRLVDHLEYNEAGNRVRLVMETRRR